MFDERFDQAVKDPDKFNELFKDRMQFVVLDTILKAADIYDASLLPEGISTNLKEILETDQINDIVYFLHSEGGRRRFLNVFTECFLVGTGVTTTLFADRNSYAYFGWIKESEYYYQYLKNDLNVWFAEFASQLSDAQLRQIISNDANPATFFSYDPSNPNPYDLDFSMISFYDARSLDKVGRNIDGIGILDLLTGAISTHIKSTMYESIVEADSKDSRLGLSEGVANDAVSAMLIYINNYVLQGRSLNSIPKRDVNLLVPFAVPDGYALDKFASGITLSNAKFIYDRFFTRTVYNLNYKNADHEVFIMRLVDLINAEIESSGLYRRAVNTRQDLIDVLTILLTNPLYSDFQEEIIEAAIASFKNKDGFFVKALKEGNGFDQLLNMLINSPNLDKFSYINHFGQYRLQFVIDYSPHFRTSQKLSLSDFKDKVFVVDLTASNDMTEITIDADLALLSSQGGLIVCHHPDPQYKDRLILVPANRISDLSSTVIEEGYKDKYGETYRNIFVSDSDNFKLVSKLEFSSQGKDIRRDRNGRYDPKWALQFYEYTPLIRDNSIVGFSSNFMAGYLLLTSDTKTALLQDTSVNLRHMDNYESPLPDLPIKTSRLDKSQLETGVSLDSARDIEMEQELARVLFEMFWISTRVYNTFYPTPSFLSMHSFDNHYSRSTIVDMLRSVHKLLPGWYSELSRFTSNPDGSITPTQLSKEDFYRNWLSTIKNDLLRDEPSGYFTEFRRALINGELNDNFYHEDNKDLIILIDRALIDAFGYPTYIFLISGILSIGTDHNGEVMIDFNLHQVDYHKELLSEWGIRPLFKKEDPGLISEGLLDIFSSLLISGYYHDFNGEMLFLRLTAANSPFILNYFAMYNPTLLNHYRNAYEIFMANSYTQFLDPSYVDDRNTLERNLIKGFLFSILDSTLDEYFKSSKWSDMSDEWKIRTRSLFKIWVGVDIIYPRYSGGHIVDYMAQLAEILHSGSDGVISISSSHNAFKDNEMLAEGIDLHIPYSELSRLSEQLFITMNYRGGRTAPNHVSPDYRLLFDKIWYLSLDEKIVESFKELRNLFFEGDNIRQEINDFVDAKIAAKQNHLWELTFRSETSKGIANQKLAYLDVYAMTFDPRDPEQVHKALTTLLFVTIMHERSLAIIKPTSRSRFLWFGSAGLLSPSYIDLSTVSNKETSQGFFWKDNPQVYLDMVDKFQSGSDYGLLTANDLSAFDRYNPPRGSSRDIYYHVLIKFREKFSGTQFSNMFPTINRNTLDLVVGLR